MTEAEIAAIRKEVEDDLLYGTPATKAFAARVYGLLARIDALARDLEIARHRIFEMNATMETAAAEVERLKESRWGLMDGVSSLRDLVREAEEMLSAMPVVYREPQSSDGYNTPDSHAAWYVPQGYNDAIREIRAVFEKFNFEAWRKKAQA